MSWFTGILVYCMVWVLILLTVLPWGVHPTETPEPGHEPGAPEKPLLLRKMLITSLIAAVVWGGIYMIIDQGWINFREMARSGPGS